MQEEVKTLRTMRQFVSWYETNLDNTSLPASVALNLNDFYIKFKYLIKQEDEANEYLKSFLG
jgi:citrate lyase synthetase